MRPQPAKLSNGLLDAFDLDIIETRVLQQHGEDATDEQQQQVEEQLKDKACAPFDDPDFRQLLKDIKKKTEIIIDEISTDEVTVAEYDLEMAKERTNSFREFIEIHKDELLALQILYSQPHAKRHLTYAAIRELSQKLSDPPYHLATADVWQAYKRLEASQVRGAPSEKVLTDIISLVRYATGQDQALELFSTRVEQRFNLWVGRQKKAGREFTDEQLDWFRLIRDYLAANAEIALRDLMEQSTFASLGGLVKARALFGKNLTPILEELNEVLVARQQNLWRYSGSGNLPSS